MKRAIAILILLLLVPGHWSPVPAEVKLGLRPYAGENIGTLQDEDSIPIDRIDAVGQQKTTPGDLHDYILGRINNVVAPAAHGHSDATTSAAGFLSTVDKLTLDAATVTTKGEGAWMSGTWTSLTTAGYTVVSAQARWPYLTQTGLAGGVHLIQTADDLAAYGVDWCAIQNAVHKGTGSLVLVNKGTYIIERPVTVPNQTVIAGMSKASFILPHTTWTGAKNLFTIPTSAYEITITGLKLQENPWPELNAGQFTGVFVNSGSYRIRIERNTAVRLAKLALVDKSSDQVEIIDNDCDDVKQEVWFSKGAADQWHSWPLVDDNDFIHTYHRGYDYAVRFEDGAQFTYLRLTNNRVSYQSLFRSYNVTTAVDGQGMFSEISGNRVIANIESDDLPTIYWVGQTSYTSKIAENFLWGASVLIEVGGQRGLSITGLTGPDSSGHTSCAIKLLAPVTNMLVSGLAPLAINTIASVCADYSLVGTGNLTITAPYPITSYVNLAGSAMGTGSELKESLLTTDDVKFLGNVQKTASIATSKTLLPDEGVVSSYADNTTVTLCKSARLVAGHRVLVFNNSNTTMTVAGNGTSIYNLAGSGGNTTTVPAYTAAEFLLASYSMGVLWRQIR